MPLITATPPTLIIEISQLKNQSLAVFEQHLDEVELRAAIKRLLPPADGDAIGPFHAIFFEMLFSVAVMPVADELCARLWRAHDRLNII